MIIIRSCRKDMTSYGGFVWPESGPVEATDWDPTPQCIGGLHGLQPGDNDPGTWYEDGKYLALEVESTSIVEIDGKCKFPRAKVLYVADDMCDLSTWLAAHGDPGPWYRGRSVSGYCGRSVSGYCGRSESGNYGRSESGDCGHSVSGYCSRSESGKYGRSESGDYGHSVSGYRGHSVSGEKGIIEISWWDGTRRRIAIGYIGEDGLEPNVAYKLGAEGRFVAVEKGNNQ